MKKITALFLAAILCLYLAACHKALEHEQSSQKTHTEATNTEGSDGMQQQSIELVGPWHLAGEKNDLAAVSDRFPGYAEWGASMEIQSNGQISWYIGAEGWHGTYTVEDGVIHAQLTSDLEQSTQLWDFQVVIENEMAELEMNYKDMTIDWIYGDQEDPASGIDNE